MIRRLRRNPLVRDLIALGQPVALYWSTVLIALLAFTGAVVFVKPNFQTEDISVLGAVWLATLVGVVVGQLCSVLRIRSALFLTIDFIAFWTGIYIAIQIEAILGGGELIGVILAMMALLGPMMASGGFWSLRVNRGILAAWAPALLFTGSIILITENQPGGISEWREGAKYAIWSAGTLAILSLAIVLQLVYMAARERHRVYRWRTADNAPEHVEGKPDPWRPFAGLGTLLMLGLLVVVLTGTSALVAPYLWRTTTDKDGDGTSQNLDDEDPAEPQESPSSGGPGLPNMQQVQRLVKQGVQVGCALLTMVVLALAGLIVFGLPARRQVLLTHLRDPMWPVPPSRRARLHWRLAEIALGDAGVHRRPGDSAKDVALRAAEQYPGVNLEALVTAAEIADRVMYGYALDAGDADTIRRAAEMTYQAVWDNLGEVERFRATYRLL